jgi:hypothetical protein
MDKSTLDKIVNTFKEKSIEFKFDYFIFRGKICLRGIFIYNKDEKNIKSILESSLTKLFKFKKTLSWYLGDRKEILLLMLKDDMETTIPELEGYQVNNEI